MSVESVYMSTVLVQAHLKIDHPSLPQVKASEAFQLASVAQLNNSEWAPLFIAPLLFLHLAKSGSAYTAYGE